MPPSSNRHAHRDTDNDAAGRQGRRSRRQTRLIRRPSGGGGGSSAEELDTHFHTHTRRMLLRLSKHRRSCRRQTRLIRRPSGVGGGSSVSRRQSSVVESAEQLDLALPSPTLVSTVDRLLPRVPVSVEAAAAVV